MYRLTTIPCFRTFIPMTAMYVGVDCEHPGRHLMSVTQIDIDQDALDRVMALSGARTKKDAVDLALRYYAQRQERAARIARHFDRARHWEAVEDAERLHRAEEDAR